MTYPDATPKELLIDFLKTIDRYYQEDKLGPTQDRLDGNLRVWDFWPTSGLCDNIEEAMLLHVRMANSDKVSKLVNPEYDLRITPSHYPVAGAQEYHDNLYKWFDDMYSNSYPGHRKRIRILRETIKRLETDYSPELMELC